MRLLIQRLLFETVVGEKVALLESLTGLVLIWDEGGPAIRPAWELAGCMVRVNDDAPD